MSPAVWFAFVWTIGKRWVFFWTLVRWTRSYPTFRDYGNTTPAYMNDLHTCWWCFDNQFPIITCWNSYFRWLHYRGHLFIGLVLNYCKSLSPGKIESELVFLFWRNEDASWCSFGSFANMLVASRLRWWKIAILLAQKNYLCAIESFVCVTNMISATQIKERLWKVWQNDKQFIFLRYRTLFKGSRLEIFAYQAAWNFPLRHHL